MIEKDIDAGHPPTAPESSPPADRAASTSPSSTVDGGGTPPPRLARSDVEDSARVAPCSDGDLASSAVHPIPPRGDVPIPVRKDAPLPLRMDKPASSSSAISSSSQEKDAVEDSHGRSSVLMRREATSRRYLSLREDTLSMEDAVAVVASFCARLMPQREKRSSGIKKRMGSDRLVRSVSFRPMKKVRYFYGSELVDWMMDNFHLSERGEAIQMVSQAYSIGIIQSDATKIDVDDETWQFQFAEDLPDEETYIYANLSRALDMLVIRRRYAAKKENGSPSRHPELECLSDEMYDSDEEEADEVVGSLEVLKRARRFLPPMERRKSIYESKRLSRAVSTKLPTAYRQRLDASRKYTRASFSSDAIGGEEPSYDVYLPPPPNSAVSFAMSGTSGAIYSEYFISPPYTAVESSSTRSTSVGDGERGPSPPPSPSPQPPSASSSHAQHGSATHASMESGEAQRPNGLEEKDAQLYQRIEALSSDERTALCDLLRSRAQHIHIDVPSAHSLSFSATSPAPVRVSGEEHVEGSMEEGEGVLHKDMLRRRRQAGQTQLLVDELFDLYHQQADQLLDILCYVELFHDRDLPFDLKSVEAAEDLFDHDITESKMALQNPLCSLMVCGDAGAGKSLFTNLLLGVDVLPTRSSATHRHEDEEARETSGTPQRTSPIRHTTALTEVVGLPVLGGGPRCHLYQLGKADPVEVSVSRIEKKEDDEASDPHHTSPGDGGEGKGPEEDVGEEDDGDECSDVEWCRNVLVQHLTGVGRSSAGIERCVMEWRSDILRNGVRLIDTPGLLDGSPLDARVHEYLPECVGIFVVVHGGRGITQSVTKLLSRALKRGLSPDSFMFVLSHPQDATHASIEAIKTHLHRLFGRMPRIVAMDLRVAMDVWTKWRIPTDDMVTFNSHLYPFLKGALRTRMKGPHTLFYGPRGHVTNWVRSVRARMAQASYSREEQLIKARRIRTSLDQARAHKDRALVNMKMVLKSTRTELEVDLHQLLSTELIASQVDALATSTDLKYTQNYDKAQDRIRLVVRSFLETYLQSALVDLFEAKKSTIVERLRADFSLLEEQREFVDVLLFADELRPNARGDMLMSELMLEPRLYLPAEFLGRVTGLLRRHLPSFSKAMLHKNPLEFKLKVARSYLSKISTPESCAHIIAQVFPTKRLTRRAKEYYAALLAYNEQLLQAMQSVEHGAMAGDGPEWLDSRQLRKLRGMNEYLAGFKLAHLMEHQCDPRKVWKIRTIGTGAFGKVWEVSYAGVEERLALKVLKQDPSSTGIYTLFEREVDVLKELGTAGTPVVQYHGCGISNEGELLIMMELMSKGDIRKVASHHTTTPRRKAHLALGAARALKYIADRGYVHRDVKGENFLVDDEDNVKVVDFGLARPAEDLAGVRGVGSFVFMAPEMMPEEVEFTGPYPLAAVGPEVDVYSFGMVLYEIVTGKHPYFDYMERLDARELMARIKNGVLRPTILEGVSAAWVGVMRKCWQTSMDKRPSWEQVVSSLQRICDEFPDRKSVV